MKKKLLDSFAIIAMLLLFAAEASAQTTNQNNQDEKISDAVNPLANALSENSADKSNKDKVNDTKNSLGSSNKTDKDANALATKKLDLVGKPLENSSLIDNIQGGMASLLMGNKAVSLMFDDRENDNLERAIDSLKSNQAYVPEESSEEDDPKQAAEKKKDEEDAAIKEKQEQDEFNKKSYIYLASIMYSTPQDWVVWINDKKITSDNNKKGKELFLKSVDKDKISVQWNVSPSKLKVLLGKRAETLNLKVNESGQIEVRFILQPNQTFVLGSNTVVEGKVVTNMIKKNVSNNKKDQSKKDSSTDLKGGATSEVLKKMMQ